MEVAWLKNNLNAPLEARQGWIQAKHGSLSIVQQCALAGLAQHLGRRMPADVHLG